jgi:hypothetical protein
MGDIDVTNGLTSPMDGNEPKANVSGERATPKLAAASAGSTGCGGATALEAKAAFGAGSTAF